MSSKIIQNYYTIKEEKEDRIIKGYKDLLLILSDKTTRNSFFKNTFYLINLPKSMKGLTSRYLIIAINYKNIIL